MPQRLDLLGQTFGRLTVVSVSEVKRQGIRQWVCRCTCGREVLACSGALSIGHISSCGCHKQELFLVNKKDSSGEKHCTNLLGKTFGRLLVVAEAGTHRSRRAIWLCRCECGNEKEICSAELLRGATKSCGCLQRDIATQMVIERCTTHGEAGRVVVTPEYRAWRGAKQRCTNPNIKSWADYGGRGISMAPEWLNSYETFLAYIGRKPEGRDARGRSLYSLDRFPNNDGNYEPGNVRWATRKQQANNKRNNIRLRAAA